MVIQRLFQNWAAALTVMVLSASSLADTVTLKSGDKIEGKILSENDKEVVIEERISPTITDTRTVQKAEVAKIDKESKDEPAYQALKNLKPGANSLPAASYDQITRNLNNFVTSFPESTHASDVKQQLALWEAEKKRVEGGEVKLNGKWLSKDDAQKERYQVNGQVILNYIQQQKAQGDLMGALNSFDQFEKNYPGASAYPDAVELAKQILPAAKAAADRALQNLKFQQAEREKGVQLLSEPQRSETLAAMKREQQSSEAAFESANKSGLKWPPMVPNEKALTAISAKVPDELRRLTEIPTAKLRQSIQVAERARGELAQKKFDDAEKSLREAQELWNANELATRLQSDLSTLRSSSTASTTPEPEATATTGTPGTTSPAPAASASSETPQSESSTDENSAEEERPFFKTPAGIATIAVVAILVLAGVSAIRKIQKRSSEIIE